MAIRKQVLWNATSEQYVGLCDYGNGTSIEAANSEATEVLVFMLVSLRGTWKWPVGYFVDKINAVVQAELVKTALILSQRSVRRRHGWNNNPNVLQFKAAMKSLLVKNSITASATANCGTFDSDNDVQFKLRWAQKKMCKIGMTTLIAQTAICIMMVCLMTIRMENYIIVSLGMKVVF
ncbi:hypothetical protein DMN91_004921 [Ooceraea biroi]|uniref:Uncharacterized protein n=1 Tax=Ooceraea biroi TaxID=2015173 RepID=A0A3L8DR27_OOCBI|nr:hypothetical protein DMN91_004921 [Ooceraea biroi]